MARLETTRNVTGRQPYLGIVANRACPRGGITNNKQAMSRSRHYAMDDITSLQLVYAGWYAQNPGVNGGVSEVNLPNTVTITASIEYPIGTFTQALFSGSASGTNGNGILLVSDPILVTIPVGAAFYVRTYQVGETSVGSFGRASIYGEAFNYGQSGIVDQTISGTVTDISSGTLCYPPAAIIGQTTKASFIIFGDSRCEGSGDSISNSYGYMGEIERSVAGMFGCINCGRGGEKAQNVAGTSADKRIQLSQYASHVISQYGVNDCSTRTAAQITTDLQTFRARFTGKPFFQSTISPVSTSTDGWVTTENQTVWTYQSVRATLNANIRKHLNGVADGVIEVAEFVETSLDSGIWQAEFTDDGTHESHTGYVTIERANIFNALRFLK